MVEIEETREVKVRPDRSYKMSAQRLSSLKQNKHERLSKVIGAENNCKLCCYTFTPREVAKVDLYAELGKALFRSSMTRYL